MTKRTLRYHHKCPGEVKKTEDLPVKKRVKKETVVKDDVLTPRANDQGDDEVKKPVVEEYKNELQNTYQYRLQRALEQRQHTIQRLTAQIA
jgi:hypothetical protein